MDAINEPSFQLPVGIVSRVDVNRAIREIQILDNFLDAAAVRTGGEAVRLPKTSRLVDELIQLNKLNALVSSDRKTIVKFLESILANSPILHMSLGADPSPLFSQKMIQWLRAEIHPFVLLQFGLQPSIGAGVILRTTNKYFDFSLRERFATKKEELIQKLRTANHSSNKDLNTSEHPDQENPTNQKEIANENKNEINVSIHANDESRH
jgi:hypothetical protein